MAFNYTLLICVFRISNSPLPSTAKLRERTRSESENNYGRISLFKFSFAFQMSFVCQIDKLKQRKTVKPWEFHANGCFGNKYFFVMLIAVIRKSFLHLSRVLDWEFEVKNQRSSEKPKWETAFDPLTSAPINRLPSAQPANFPFDD